MKKEGKEKADAEEKARKEEEEKERREKGETDEEKLEGDEKLGEGYNVEAAKKKTAKSGKVIQQGDKAFQ